MLLAALPELRHGQGNGPLQAVCRHPPPLSPVAVTVYPAAGTGNTAALRAASLSAQKAARPPVCKDAPLIRCQAAV